VSYGIIQAHRGTISVDSTPDVGTTFTISLPLYEEANT
jgi:signal transduction histidine kinase